MSVSDTDITSDFDVINALADNDSHNVYSAFSTDNFTACRNKAQQHSPNFSSENAEVINRPFSVEESQDALDISHDTSVGLDEIYDQLLKHLPISSLSVF